jgi:hypothetical protein
VDKWAVTREGWAVALTVGSDELTYSETERMLATVREFVEDQSVQVVEVACELGSRPSFKLTGMLVAALEGRPEGLGKEIRIVSPASGAADLAVDAPQRPGRQQDREYDDEQGKAHLVADVPEFELGAVGPDVLHNPEGKPEQAGDVEGERCRARPGSLAPRTRPKEMDLHADLRRGRLRISDELRELILSLPPVHRPLNARKIHDPGRQAGAESVGM